MPSGVPQWPAERHRQTWGTQSVANGVQGLTNVFKEETFSVLRHKVDTYIYLDLTVCYVHGADCLFICQT